MKVTKQEIVKSQQELIVEIALDEFKPHIDSATEMIAKEVKIDGFRSGKIPFDVLKQKVGEMSILEEAARIAIHKTLDKALLELGEGKLIGQPKVDISKLAPNNPLEYKIHVALIPEITLGKYKELGIKEDKIEIKDEDLNKTLDELKEMKASEILADREIKEGDKVLVDIKMFHDNVPVEGGQAQATGVLVGQDHLVPGFDKELVGLKKGDTKDFKLPYPEDHFMKNLAGKMVDFKVDIKEVYERVIPELNDEFAQGFGVKDLKEMKDNIKKGIENEKKQERMRQTEKEMLEKLIDNTKFGDIPEMLIQQEADNMIAELKQGVEQQGGKFEDYLKSLGKQETEIKLDMMGDAIKRVKASLLIREIANVEKVKVTDKEIDEQINHMKEHYKDKKDVIARIESKEYRNYVVNVQTSRKVIDSLLKWNVSEKK